MDDEAKFKELLEDEAFTSKLATLETAEEVKSAADEAAGTRRRRARKTE